MHVGGAGRQPRTQATVRRTTLFVPSPSGLYMSLLVEGDAEGRAKATVKSLFLILSLCVGWWDPVSL